MGRILSFKSVKESADTLARECIEDDAQATDELAEFLRTIDIRVPGQAIPMTSEDGEPVFASVVYNNTYNNINYSVISFLKDSAVEKYVKGEVTIDDTIMQPTLLVVRVTSATDFVFIGREEYDELIHSTDIATDLKDSPSVLDLLNKLLVISIQDAIDRLGLKINPKFYRRDEGDK